MSLMAPLQGNSFITPPFPNGSQNIRPTNTTLSDQLQKLHKIHDTCIMCKDNNITLLLLIDLLLLFNVTSVICPLTILHWYRHFNTVAVVHYLYGKKSALK
jgi:hypothetical protein